MGEKPVRIKKRLFFALVALSLLPVLAGMWLIFAFSLWEQFGHALAIVAFILLTFMLIFAAFGLLSMIYMIETGKGLKVKLPLRLIIDVFYPMALRAGAFLGLSRDKIQNSFVEVSNALVKTVSVEAEPEEVLILVPHCIQLSECTHKITVDINNCKGCGRCQVSQIKDLAAKYGVDLAVATGGGMARRIIQQRKPKAVVAVACERDLTSGLQETFPLPVFGVVNLRPQGYCVNTGVDVNKLKSALEFFIHGDLAKESYCHRQYEEVASSRL